jgi:hypothetical protein
MQSRLSGGRGRAWIQRLVSKEGAISAGRQIQAQPGLGEPASPRAERSSHRAASPERSPSGSMSDPPTAQRRVNPWIRSTPSVHAAVRYGSSPQALEDRPGGLDPLGRHGHPSPLRHPVADKLQFVPPLFDRRRSGAFSVRRRPARSLGAPGHPFSFAGFSLRRHGRGRCLLRGSSVPDSLLDPLMQRRPPEARAAPR